MIGRTAVSGVPVRVVSRAGRAPPGPLWGDGLEDESPLGSACDREDLICDVSKGVAVPKSDSSAPELASSPLLWSAASSSSSSLIMLSTRRTIFPTAGSWGAASISFLPTSLTLCMSRSELACCVVSTVRSRRSTVTTAHRFEPRICRLLNNLCAR